MLRTIQDDIMYIKTKKTARPQRIHPERNLTNIHSDFLQSLQELLDFLRLREPTATAITLKLPSR